MRARGARAMLCADSMSIQPLMRASSLLHGLWLATLVVGQSAWAGKDCDAPPELWQPRSAVLALAERQGWEVEKLKIDDGCYELRGRDADGRRLKAKIDPATLEVLGVKRAQGARERARERERQGQRPAPSPATPQDAPRAGPAEPGTPTPSR